MIIRNSRFKQILPDNFTYKGTKYTKAYAKGKQLFGYSDDDYAYQYFTIESLEDGNVITLTIGSGVTSSQMTSISYSVDGGSTWTTTNVNSTTQTINVNLDKGDIVLWKGVGTNLANNYEENGQEYRTTFSSTKKYSIYGNIMSLLYGDSFSNKTSVTANYAFCGLFYQSSKLVDAQNFTIPIKNINKLRVFTGTFRSCTSLVTPPHFTPESITAQHGCQRMFRDCTSLVSTPNLSKLTTITGESACIEMFRDCTSLTTAPELPSTTLANYCYYRMFLGCTSLTTAPKLPATTLAQNCYQEMFYGCTSLNEITCLATDISATNCTKDWVKNVASTGTFIKADGMSSWTINSNNGIPIGWTVMNYENCTVTLTVNNPSYGNVTGAGTYRTGERVTIKANIIELNHFVGWYQNNNLVTTNQYYSFEIFTDMIFEARFASGEHDYSQDYFTIESLEDGNSITCVYNAPSGSSTPSPISSANTQYMNDIYYSYNNGVTWQSTATATFKTWVLNAGEKVLLKTTYSRFALGESNYNSFTSTKNINVSGNILSLIFGDNFQNASAVRANWGFSKLFMNCTTLINAKDLVLPATNLTSYCYDSMFYGCSSLVSAPKLPATTLAGGCYRRMFVGCKKVTTAPNLPATTLEGSCYQSMFQSCISLKTIPTFTVSTVGPASCYYMFAYCNHLQNASMIHLDATALADSCYQGMFLCCTRLTSAPILPAITLADSSYAGMFDSCTSLKTIVCLAKNITFEECLYYWVYRLGTTGTFYKNSTMSSWPTGVSGIPTGWTVENYVQS